MIPQKHHLSVINMTGQEVLKKDFYSSQIEIDLAGLVEGIYTVIVESGRKVSSKQVIVIPD